jgi:hypothetical protein
VDRVILILCELHPPKGIPPAGYGRLKKATREVIEKFKERKEELVGPDSLRRAIEVLEEEADDR